MVHSQQKGARNENDVSKLIQPWWRLLEPECEFVRTPKSGGWSNAKVRGEFKASGDLMTTSHTFPFVVEVKCRENWTLGNVLDGKRSPVWGWWRQAIHAAAEQQGVPMLWFRKAEKVKGKKFPWLILVPHSWYEARGYFIAPDVTLDLRSNVDVSGVHPCLYFADRFTSTPPQESLKK